MGCSCGGGSGLANYEVKDKTGTVVKTFSAVTQTEVTTFAAKLPGATWRKTS
jgi:hypothetical protein